MRRIVPATALAVVSVFSLMTVTAAFSASPSGAATKTASKKKPASKKKTVAKPKNAAPTYGHFTMSGEIKTSWSVTLHGCVRVQTSAGYGVDLTGSHDTEFAAVPDSPNAPGGKGTGFPTPNWGALITYTSPQGKVYVWDASGKKGVKAGTSPASGADGSGHVTLTHGFRGGSVQLKLQPGGPDAARLGGATNSAESAETISGSWSCPKSKLKVA